MIRCIAAVGIWLLGATLALAQTSYHRDIRPIMQTKCLNCHSQAGVSFSMEDHDVAYGFRAAMASAVAERRMPPWLAEPGHQTYADDYSLTEAEVQKFAAWAAEGFARGDAAAEPTTAVELGAGYSQFEAELAIDIMPGTSYLPRQNQKDDYRCFLLEWPYQTEKYITGFQANPGNLKVAHHLVAHVGDPEVADYYRELEAAEEGLGYQCFGGSVPDRLGDEAVAEAFEEKYPGAIRQLYRQSYWLAHWAPGTYGYTFPQDSGILIRPGSVILVQMHYYSSFAPGEYDENTNMSFKVADSVEKPSINYPLTSFRWLTAKRNQSMVIDPGSRDTYEVSVSFKQIANEAAHILRMPVEQIQAIELASANVHMHSFGAAGKASLLSHNGRKETLLSIPRWDLNWQRDFLFDQPKRITLDQFERSRLQVECEFENYSQQPVYGGYGSDDEMCFNFSYISIIKGEAPEAKAAKVAAGR